MTYRFKEQHFITYTNVDIMYLSKSTEPVIEKTTQSSADQSFGEGLVLPAVPTFQMVEDKELLQGKFQAIQRQEAEEEKHLQGKFETVQKMAPEEEKPLQGKFMDVQQAFAPVQKKENSTGMPDNLKAGVENLSGMTMDNVKVHYNSSRPTQLNAHAYAQGTDIHIAPGQEGHLPHEAWHVVQQAQGRVKPTMQMKENVPVNDDPGLEHEADVMGAKALAG